MGWTEASLIQAAAWLGGLTAALIVFRSQTTRGWDRFAIALVAGAIAAHLGWALLHLPRVLRFPEWILQPGAASVLFFPVGVLLVAPWREALASVPLALAVARLGCLPYDCCYLEPAAAFPELAGLVLLHFLAIKKLRYAPWIVLSGFGLLRIVSLPLRAPLDPRPFLEPAWVAVCWIVAGFALSSRIGSAEQARDWFSERTQPLLRSVSVMLIVWVLFPVMGHLLSADSALLSASVLGTVVVIATRPPRFPIGARSIGYATSGVAIGAGLFLLTSHLLPLSVVTTARTAPATLSVLIAVAVLIPVLEEVLYRGRLLDDLLSLWGRGTAILLSSGLFALAHVDPGAMLVPFLGGIVSSIVVLRTRSLAPSIGLHVGWNAIAVALAVWTLS